MREETVEKVMDPLEDLEQAIIFATSAPLMDEQWRFIFKNMQHMELSDRKAIGKIIVEMSKSFQIMQMKNDDEVKEIKASAKKIGNAMRDLAKDIPLLEGKLTGYPFFQKEEQLDALIDIVYGGKLKKTVKEKTACALLDIVLLLNHGLSIFGTLPDIKNKKLKAEVTSTISAGRKVLSLHLEDMCRDCYILEEHMKDAQKANVTKKARTKKK